MGSITGIRAVGKWLLVTFWAVLFCASAGAQDFSLDRLESGLNDLIYRLSRSVVTVEVYYSLQSSPEALVEDEAVYNVIATGVIYDSTGHVLTMVPPLANRSRIQVRFEDLVVPAELKAVDYRTGLAVLTLARAVGRPVELSRQQGCAGQILIALGNSYGLRAAPSLGFCAGVRPDGVVQFSAPITSGTVGGGLFDLSGRMIGLIAGGANQSERAEVALAIPSYKVAEAASYLINKGSRLAGYLGLSTAEIEVFPPLEVKLAKGEGTDIIIERGVVVTNVVSSSPAARAGLRKGDLLFTVNNQKVPSALQLADFVKSTVPGTVIELGVLRQNRPYYVPVKVGEAESRSVRTSFSFVFESVRPTSVTDSLMQEIEALKETIKYLEVRLKQLR